MTSQNIGAAGAPGNLPPQLTVLRGALGVQRGAAPARPGKMDQIEHPGVAFLRELDPTGRHNLVICDQDGNWPGKTFEPGDWAGMDAFIRAHDGRDSLYFSVNEPYAGAPHKKLSKGDIASIRMVCADRDLEPHEPLDSGKQRLTAHANAVNARLPATYTLDSGGGIQMFWCLGDKADASTSQEWAEAQCRGLAQFVEGDAVIDINRVMRLPFTQNIPTPKKLAWGRIQCEARLLHQRGPTYTKAQLSSAVPPVLNPPSADTTGAVAEAAAEIDLDAAEECSDLSALPGDLTQRLRDARLADPKLDALLRDGVGAKDEGDRSPSGLRASLVARLARHGFSAQDYACIVYAWPTGWPAGLGSDGLTLRTLSRDWGNCSKAGPEPIDPDQWFDASVAAAQPQNDPPASPTLPAVRAGRISPEDLIGLPPRQWLYGTKISRRYVTFLASPGGVGKTAYVFAMALAAAASQALLHDSTKRPLRVWIYNLEDDIVELRRRLVAVMKHYGLDPAVLSNIRLNSGRDRRFRIVQARDGNFVVQPDFYGVIEEMRAEQIDILVVDPYLRSHGVSENENEAQDEVMRLYADIAEATNAGIVLVHHTKKGAVAGDMDSLRGGSTQGGGARAAYTLSPMASEDAEKLGIPDEERRLYVRMDDAKNNMAPPAQRAEWLRLVGVRLENGTEDYPHGDNVQVATAWTPPTAWEGSEEGKEAEVLRRIEAGPSRGERYSIRPQDKERWAGNVLIEMCACSIGQAKATLEGWQKQRMIWTDDYRSELQRKTRKGVYVKKLAEVAEMGIFG